jgi:hypothetical protein
VVFISIHSYKGFAMALALLLESQTIEEMNATIIFICAYKRVALSLGQRQQNDV